MIPAETSSDTSAPLMVEFDAAPSGNFSETEALCTKVTADIIDSDSAEISESDDSDPEKSPENLSKKKKCKRCVVRCCLPSLLIFFLILLILTGLFFLFYWLHKITPKHLRQNLIQRLRKVKAGEWRNTNVVNSESLENLKDGTLDAPTAKPDPLGEFLLHISTNSSNDQISRIRQLLTPDQDFSLTQKFSLLQDRIAQAQHWDRVLSLSCGCLEFSRLTSDKFRKHAERYRRQFSRGEVTEREYDRESWLKTLGMYSGLRGKPNLIGGGESSDSWSRLFRGLGETYRRHVELKAVPPLGEDPYQEVLPESTTEAAGESLNPFLANTLPKNFHKDTFRLHYLNELEFVQSLSRGKNALLQTAGGVFYNRRQGDLVVFLIGSYCTEDWVKNVAWNWPEGGVRTGCRRSDSSSSFFDSETENFLEEDGDIPDAESSMTFSVTQSQDHDGGLNLEKELEESLGKEYLSSFSKLGGRLSIHKGFLHFARGILKQLKPVINEFKNKNLVQMNRIVFCGFSLGAALASILTYLVMNSQKILEDLEIPPGALVVSDSESMESAMSESELLNAKMKSVEGLYFGQPAGFHVKDEFRDMITGPMMDLESSSSSSTNNAAAAPDFFCFNLLHNEDRVIQTANSFETYNTVGYLNEFRLEDSEEILLPPENSVSDSDGPIDDNFSRVSSRPLAAQGPGLTPLIGSSSTEKEIPTTLEASALAMEQVSIQAGLDAGDIREEKVIKSTTTSSGTTKTVLEMKPQNHPYPSSGHSPEIYRDYLLKQHQQWRLDVERESEELNREVREKIEKLIPLNSDSEVSELSLPSFRSAQSYWERWVVEDCRLTTKDNISNQSQSILNFDTKSFAGFSRRPDSFRTKIGLGSVLESLWGRVVGWFRA